MNQAVLRYPTELFEAYVFDMDGTIYLGDHLLPGAARMINELRRRDIPVRFLSNNPTKDPQMYVEKLTRLGLPTAVGDIANTIVTTVTWLLENHPEATVYPIAEQPLVNALREAGIRISEDPAEIDIVISSYDRGFEYRKLQIAFDAIWFHKRAFLIETNPDRFCPFQVDVVNPTALPSPPRSRPAPAPNANAAWANQIRSCCAPSCRPSTPRSQARSWWEIVSKLTLRWRSTPEWSRQPC